MKIETLDDLFNATVSPSPDVLLWLNNLIDGKVTVEQLRSKFGAIRFFDTKHVDGDILNPNIDGMVRNCYATTVPVALNNGTIRGVVFYNYEFMKNLQFEGLMQTLVHESVHVKQIGMGLMSGEQAEWNCNCTDGAEYNADIVAATVSGNWGCIHKYPWEIEAYGAQYQLAQLFGADISELSDLMRIFYEIYPEYKGLDAVETIKLAKGDYVSL